MGMYAGVVAIGPFSRNIAKYLNHSTDHLRGTRSGTIVVVELFGMPGSSSSREFAKYLGITSIADFNQHPIDPRKVNVEKLKTFLVMYGEEFVEDFEAFIALRDHGFEFIFEPNG